MYKYAENHPAYAPYSAPSSSPPPSVLYPHIVVEEGKREEEERREEGRGKESIEDAPYPPVEIWKPPAHRWYHKQFVGKTIGKIFIAGGGWSLYQYFHEFALRKSSVYVSRKVTSQVVRTTMKTGSPLYLIGAVFVGVGIYLHCIKYIRDPKAAVKYRKRIFDPSSSFINVVDEFGWNDLLIIATKEELSYKLYQEMQSIRGLYQVCSIYKVDNLRAFLKYDIMRAIDVEARWEYDVSRAAEGTGPELGIVVQECGEFLLTASRLQADKVRESLERDPTMVAYTFVDVFTKFESSIRRIFKKGFLSTPFLRHKLITQLNTDPTFKFSIIAKHRWVVDCLCTPSEIALAFRAARENCSCIATFLEQYWAWPIDTYQTLIIPDELELSKLRQIYHESQAYQTSIQKDLEHVTKRYNENITEASRTKDRKREEIKRETNKYISQLHMRAPQDGLAEIVNQIYQKQDEDLEKLNEDERVAQRRERQAKEDAQRSAERRAEQKKMDLHREWRSFLAQRRYSGPVVPPYTPNYSYTTPSAPPM